MHHDSTSPRIALIGAAHFDRTGWLAASADAGCSNPGRFEEHPGGTALNIAGVLSSLKISSQLFTHLGDDELAYQLITTARQRNIDIFSQHSHHNNTGTYTSMVEPDGSLFIALADMAIYDEFDASIYTNNLQGFGKKDFVGIDANLPASELQKLALSTPARIVGFTVSKAKAARLSGTLDQLDTLFTNSIEVCALTKTSNVQGAIKSLQSAGIPNTVISDGEKAVWILENASVTKLAIEPLYNVIDVTGAGDALAGGTLFGLHQGQSLTKAVEIGVRAAQKMIQTKGPWCPDLIDILDVPST